MKLTHFTLIHFLALFLFSCESDSKKVDPLFYQMSTLDSTKYMGKLFERMRRDASKFEEERVLSLEEVPIVPCCGCHTEILNIYQDSMGKIKNHHGIKKVNNSDVVVDFFMRNRNERYYLREDGMNEVWDFNFPRYSLYSKEELEAKLNDQIQEYKEVKIVPNVDAKLLEYYESEYHKTENWLEILRILKTGKLYLNSDVLFIEVNCPNSKNVTKEIIDEVLDGYYRIRNYECIRYFGETYLSLFHRTFSRKRKVDKDKLDALESFRPILVFNTLSANRRAIHSAPEVAND